MIAAHERPKLSEAQFQRQVVRYADLMGWRVRHDRATNQRSRCRRCRSPLVCASCATPVTVVRNDAGLLDLLLVRRPRIVWAELKSQRGTMTDDQLATYLELKACGQEVYLWKPSDWPVIERILR